MSALEESKSIGDMPVEEFREFGHKMIDWIADYLKDIEELPVLPDIKPGDIKSQLPENPPETGEEFSKIFRDVDDLILPGVTHWNHPNFMAYFNSTASGPGILAEMLTAAFNINGMVWKTCPSSAELEETMLNWLKQILNLPENFWGIIYDTASVSTMHAVACAREYYQDLEIRKRGMSGRNDLQRLRVYASEHAHSSIDKAALTLGLGLEGIHKIEVDDQFRMIPEKLAEAIEEDLSKGYYPICVVATIGTTSTTSADPLEKIAEIAKSKNIWLHVDAAHSGVTAMLPEMAEYFSGIEHADSMVVNPHKWLFTPIDLSVFYTKHPDVLKSAFSLVHEYLKTAEDNSAINYMDYGIQLGRRFRSLKLWFIIRYFGKNGLADRIREHIRLGNMFTSWVDASENFERLAPVPFSTVCFRALKEDSSGEEINNFNQNLMDEINKTGKLFLSHTKLNEKFSIRLVVSGIRTEERHVKEAWNLIQKVYNEKINDPN